MTTRRELRDKFKAKYKYNEPSFMRGVGRKNVTYNFKTTQTDNKPNFGAGGNRKVKVSLAKVNLPEEREE